VGGFGVANCTARIAAQKVTELASNAPGLSAPAAIAESVQFAHRSSVFAGPSYDFAFKRIAFSLSHSFTHDPYNSEWGKITKQGPLEVSGRLEGRFMDEMMALRADALAKNVRTYRLTLAAGANSLVFDFKNLVWEGSAEHGFEDRDARDFVQNFRAGVADFATDNPVRIIIT
jgi:hypothetical protein